MVLLHNSEEGIFKLTHHQKCLRQLYWIFDLRTIRGCTCHKEHNPYKMLPNDSLHFSICDSANKVNVFELDLVEMNLPPQLGLGCTIVQFSRLSLSLSRPLSLSLRMQDQFCFNYSQQCTSLNLSNPLSSRYLFLHSTFGRICFPVGLAPYAGACFRRGVLRST